MLADERKKGTTRRQKKTSNFGAKKKIAAVNEPTLKCGRKASKEQLVQHGCNPRRSTVSAYAGDGRAAKPGAGGL